jgi:hypothetical protein
MQATSTASLGPVVSSSLSQRLFNLFACPGDVFDEVAWSPANAANWRVPTLLTCLSGIILTLRSPAMDQMTAALKQLAQSGAVSTAQAEFLAGAWPLVSCLGVCLAVVAGSLWSAIVFWGIGRFFLKTSFSFLKALEVVGLSGMILVLGSLVTGLLISATGDPHARPSLWLLAGKLHGNALRQVLNLFDLFHLWSMATMTIGLSRLTGVSFKEAGFWIFGYWCVARIALILLA